MVATGRLHGFVFEESGPVFWELEVSCQTRHRESCYIPCTWRLELISVQHADSLRVLRTIPISGCFLMSSRDAFIPLLAAANVFSHDFNSARRVFDSAVNVARSSSFIS
jgi:hypothetical protein